MKGLICSIYQNPNGNFSMRGISTRATEVLLVPDPDAHCDFGIPKIFDAADLPVVVLRTRKIGDKEYLRAVPVELTKGIHSMMGGCFIWSSDSRFPADYPIPLHDRVEV
jgi:hypothetical protein